MARPKLRDVAALAGVSEPTVSRVLNGKVGVAPATRDRVVVALRELGWTDVQAPLTERHGVIGVVTGEFSNPVFPALIDAISLNLALRDHLTTVAMTAPQLNTEERCIDEFVRSGVDGIVLLGGRHAEVDGDLSKYEQLIGDEVPVVFVNGRRTELAVPHVLCDEQAGAHKAVEHLISLDHTRIGCLLGSPGYTPTQRMIDGHAQALSSAGLTQSPDDIIATAFTLEAGMAGARRLIDQGYTAILTANDLMALGAIGAATSMGRSVPDEFSVVGYDGTALTGLTAPPLTTLRQPFEKMTRLVVEAMLSELEGSPRYRDHYVFEPELVSRGSSGRLARPSRTQARPAPTLSA